MNNKDKDIKIQASRPFETFLSWLTVGFAPETHWVCLQCAPRPPAACLGLFFAFTTFAPPPKFNSRIRPWYTLNIMIS